MKALRDKFVTAILISLLVVSLSFTAFSALAGGLFFIGMPSRSAEFDCDDAAKFVYDRLSKLGVDPTIMLGSLKKTGESYSESDHVWLLVSLGPLTVPLDREGPYFGKQYYEGHPINYEKLLFFVKQDFEKQGKGGLPAENN